MSDVPMSMPYEQRHLSLFGRLLFLGICGLSIAAFWHLGWNALGPHDPLGAVSLYTHSHPFLGSVQSIVFAAAISAMATLILGRRMPHVGAFAVGVGLVALSTRGGTATYLLLERAASIQHSKFVFTVGLIAESLGWFAVIAAAIASADFVGRIVLGLPRSFPGFEMPSRAANKTQGVLRSNKRTADNENTNPLMQHLLHVMICTVTAVAAIVIFSSGYRTRGVEHGQACFIAAAGMGLGTYIAHRVQPVASSTWSLLAIAPVAIIGYAWTVFCRVNADLPLPMLSSPFLSLLPIQLVGAGLLGAVWVIWYFTGQPSQEN